MNENFISRYSPTLTDPEKLEAISVQREDLFDETVEKVATSILTKNKHHMVFFGPRGSGKTHLVSIIHHRVSSREDLKDQMYIAWLNEEETSSTFLSLLLRIYSALSTRYPKQFPKEFAETIYDLKNQDDAVETLGKSLKSIVAERTVLVLIENLDSLFRDFDHEEQKRWRAFIQNNPQIFCTLATAQRLSDDFSSQDFPFFGFFNVTHLKPLTIDEAGELLTKIAVLNEDNDLIEFLSEPKGKGRVSAIHHLTGGNHRLFTILSDFVNRDSLNELVGPFRELVDEELTPYYQERLRWLSTQQRMIVEFLCKSTKPVPVKEISRHLFIPHATITGQLRHLRETGCVIANKRGKESLYELAEPLMRLTYQIKEAKDSSPLRIIVEFLRIWYEKRELEALSSESSSTGNAIQNYIIEALQNIDKGNNFVRESGPEPRQFLNPMEALEKSCAIETENFLSGSCELPNLFTVCLQEFGVDVGIKKFSLILELLDKHNVLEAASASLLTNEFVAEISNSHESRNLLDMWGKYAAEFTGLKLGVRLLTAVVKFLQTDRNPKILLDVHLEERKIAEDFLASYRAS